MKKLLSLMFIAGTAFSQPPSAGWNFGNDTYGQRGGSLILNSLSDRYGISTFQTVTQSLGTNDYIQESGVKNTLALDGYTAAWDYNPTSLTGYGYASVYNQPLPNAALTKMTFMGLDGDPTKAQDVYVLTSEYNKLSAQGQASSITTLFNQVSTQNNAINSETVNRINGDTVLQTEINSTNSQVTRNTSNISVLTTGLSTETSERKAADVNLQNQLNSTSDRVSKLEQVKVMADVNIRLLDTKKFTVGIFDMFDGSHARNFAFGARLTYKIGKSYEETVMEKQQKQLDAQATQIRQLQALLQR